MNATIAICAIAMMGWVSPDAEDPNPQSQDKLPAQPTLSQPASLSASLSQPAPSQQGLSQPGRQQPQTRSATQRPTAKNGDAVAGQPRIPLPPTDPRALANGYFPRPPTMNGVGTPATVDLASPGQRPYVGLPADNGHRVVAQKPFERYLPGPATSPYLLLNSPTANGTINPYMAYVRPAQAQQQANQDMDHAVNSAENPVEQPAPTYPRFFLNTGSYYPENPAAR